MKQQNKLVTWHDGDITGGGKARQEDILKEVADSDILLYLVSAYSLASENCNRELAEALGAEIRVLPIILESCDWLNHQLSDFQALPDKGKPINKWQPESDGWQNVVEGVRKAVEEMQTDVQKGTLPEWVFQQGNFLLMLGQTDRAIEAYSHAIELNPNDADAYNNRGVVYRGKGDYDRAIADYNKAIQLNPGYADAYNNRGVAYQSKGDFDSAVEDYSEALGLNPNSADVYNNRGAACYLKGDFDRAIEDFNTAMQIKPDYAEAYNGRGSVYSGKGNYDCAIKDYNKAIDLNPDYANAYNNRGVAYQCKGLFDRGIADHTKAIGIKPDYASAYNNRGIAYLSKSDFARAIECFSTTIKLKPDYADAYCDRGMAWLHLGEWEKTRTDLMTARGMAANIVASFHNGYENVADFEQRNGVKLPADIATMLTP